MHHTIVILFALAATSMGINLPQPYLERRDQTLNTGPGCISYTDPSALLLNQNTVTEAFSGGSSTLSQSDLATCLNEYGCGNFANSWDGSVCGGRGWFKGPPNSKTSNTECYQVLAPWVLLNGIREGQTYYKAMFGHDCYMGFNDPGPDSSSQ